MRNQIDELSTELEVLQLQLLKGDGFFISMAEKIKASLTELSGNKPALDIS